MCDGCNCQLCSRLSTVSAQCKICDPTSGQKNTVKPWEQSSSPAVRTQKWNKNVWQSDKGNKWLSTAWKSICQSTIKTLHFIVPSNTSFKTVYDRLPASQEVNDVLATWPERVRLRILEVKKHCDWWVKGSDGWWHPFRLFLMSFESFNPLTFHGNFFLTKF